MSKLIWFIAGMGVGAALVVLLSQEQDEHAAPLRAIDDVAQKGARVEALAELFSAN